MVHLATKGATDFYNNRKDSFTNKQVHNVNSQTNINTKQLQTKDIMAAGSSSNTLGQTYGSHIHTVEKRLITNADASVSALDRIFGPSGWDAQGWSALQAAEDRIGGDEAMRRDPTLIVVSTSPLSGTSCLQVQLQMEGVI